jgi:4-amino-4-deoxy-L-arabinose transferase-like glycosyltransferase
MKKIKTWILANKLETFILVLILLVGAFFRLYKIDQYMTFLGDEGRDAIIVRRLLVDFDLILIGPGTSIGNMYLGPLYYYLISPFLLIFAFNPVGPSVMIALFGVATIFLVWYIAKDWFPSSKSDSKDQPVSKTGLIAAGLYAISPVVINYSRSSWNPNIMPFFALLTIYSTWKVWTNHNFKWTFVTAISMAFVLQSHYLGLLLVPVIALFWILTFLETLKLNTKGHWFKSNFIKHTIYSGILFLLLMSPLLIFDFRHGWQNFQAMKLFFTERQTTVSARPWSAIPKIWPLAVQYAERIMAGMNYLGGVFTTIFSVSTFTWLIISRLREITVHKKKAYILLFVWLSFALVGFGVYKQHIYDHYFGIIYPAGFILFGALINELGQYFTKLGKFVLLLIVATLIILNLIQNPLLYEPNRQLQRAQNIANKIETVSNRMPLNLAVIAEQNYEDGYQYFLEKQGIDVLEIDPQRHDETVAGQLFAVCEYGDKDKCDPTHNPKAQIANFGWSKIESSWEIEGVILYKLVHVFQDGI